LDTLTGKLRERRELLSFVSPQVLESLSGGNLLELARGRSREATVLASDLRDFTTMTETYEPRLVFALVNRHLQAMAEAIRRHGGVIDRFVGDAVFAVFYAEQGEDHVRAALKAAREMNDAHRAIQADRQANGLFGYRMGIGIETGRLLTGVLGDSETRLDFTVLGDIVTRAAELESASRHGSSSRIVVSEAIREGWCEPGTYQPIPGHEKAWELVEGRSSTNLPLVTHETGMARSPAITTTGTEPSAEERKSAHVGPSGALAVSPRDHSTPMVLAIFLLIALSLSVAYLSWNERLKNGEVARARQVMQSAVTHLTPERILIAETRRALQGVAADVVAGKLPDEACLKRFRDRTRSLFDAAPKWQTYIGLFPEQEPIPAGSPTYTIVGSRLQCLVSDHRGDQGKLPFFSEPENEFMSALAQAYILDRHAEKSDFMPELGAWKEKTFDTRGFKAKDYSEIFARCLNNISWEVNVNQTVGIGCFPIFRATDEDLAPVSQASVSAELFDPQRVRSRLLQTRRQMKGVLLVYLDQQAASLEHLLPFLVENHRREGYEIEIVEEGGGSLPLCRNQTFQTDPELREVLRQPFAAVVETSSWLVLQEVAIPKKAYRIVLAAPKPGLFNFSATSGLSALGMAMPRSGALTSDRTNEGQSFHWFSLTFWVMFLAGLLPIYWFIDRAVRRFFDQEFLSLRHHLAGHFLLAVIPVLFLVWQMLERARYESEERLNSNARMFLQDQIQRLERSTGLFDA
ncbi:MAG TPA: adenylate/guanylate cyclase domain-containing protein, partial [Candidatus Ozemobacteraceae bacterium]|nr:adenylate/guanylate cyclase domain-containing protein [Candidatus Ozemobacteraceae bacterium]